MITASQLRAARGLIDWTRNELAKAAGVSPETIKNIEHGIFRPQEETAGRIVKTFAAHDVLFTDGEGVKISKQVLRTFIGREGYEEFLDDIADTLKDGGITRQFNFSDTLIATYGGATTEKYMKRMKDIKNLDSKCLVPEGDTNFPASHCEYKWLNKSHSMLVPYYIYNNKVAMMTSSPQEEITFVSVGSAPLAKAYIEQFNVFWKESVPVSTRKSAAR